MRKSTPDAWVALGKILPEINGVEARVDVWINAVRNNDFSEGDCARDLGSLIAQFDHLAETTFNQPDLDVAEQQVGLAHTFDYDLDNFAAAVGFARQAIIGLVSEGGECLPAARDISLTDPLYRSRNRSRGFYDGGRRVRASTEDLGPGQKCQGPGRVSPHLIRPSTRF